MKLIGLFNIAYGALGLIAALYLGRADALMLCLWVMTAGIVLRFIPFLQNRRKFKRRLNSIVRRAYRA